MNKENCTILCRGKRLSDYLVKHGSILIDSYHLNGSVVFEFKYDESIDKNLKLWESNKKKWLF